MYLNEIENESVIQISVGIGMQVLEFSTKVMEIKEQSIYAEPIMRDDKIVGFSTKGLIINICVVNKSDMKAYQFNNVAIKNIKTPDGNLFHEIFAKMPGKIVNRRNACRVWLGIDGIAQIGLNKKTYEVIIKDISVSGIAFICREDVVASPGMVVHLSFTDENTKTKFNIGAIIVRSEEMENYRIMYGCKLNQESNAISKYVNEKQREKLRATRTINAIPLDKKSKEI